MHFVSHCINNPELRLAVFSLIPNVNLNDWKKNRIVECVQ